MATAAADTFTWTGASPNVIGISNNWGNPLNWQANAIPTNDGLADVVMPDTPRDNPNLNQPWTINSLTFQGPGNYSVNGDQLTVDDITHNGTGTATFDSAVGVAGDSRVWRATSGPMTFNGAISGSSLLTIEAPHEVTFDGTAANTLSGAVRVTQGTLVLSKSSVPAIAGNLQILGGTVRWDASDQAPNGVTSQITVTNSGVANLNGKNEGVGQFVLSSGGRVQSTGGLLTVVGQLALQDSAEVDLGAGALELRASVNRSGSSSSTSHIKAAQITLNIAQAIVFVDDSSAAIELEVTGPIAGAFPGTFLEKSGTGTLSLKGASTYQGGTTISGGVLAVNNTTGSGTGTGTVTVATGARLAGDGALSGSVLMQNGAIISPSAATGFPIGSLSIGSLSMNTTSKLEIQFNQALPLTTRRDVLTVNGAAQLNGNLVLENLNFAVLPSSGDVYTVLTASSITGSFANVANGTRLTTSDGSGSFLVRYGAGSPFPSNTIVLHSFLPTKADFNNNGPVDGNDFLVWQRGGSPNPLSAQDLARWKATYGVQLFVAAPEPSAAALALFAFVLLGVPRLGSFHARHLARTTRF
jgi:autotransporter-associated beta strand protein